MAHLDLRQQRHNKRRSNVVILIRPPFATCRIIPPLPLAPPLAAMLRLILSNRFDYLLENLLLRLDGDAQRADSSPFDAPQIIVPSTSIQRRLTLSYAERNGVCAHVEFSYLAQWLWRQMGHVIEVQEVSPFSPDLLSWRVYEIFGDEKFSAAHPRLARYLGNADALMRMELAQHSAQLIEHYITYRPQWLAAWSDGKPAGIVAPDGRPADDEGWQAALWRRITAELGTRRQHPSTLFFQAMEQLGDDAPHRVGLPTHTHIFCLPTLPPLYLNILRQLARWIDITLYVLNPCEEYWFEVVDRKRLGYLNASRRETYHEVGNTLLAAWGKQTQSNIDLLFSDNSPINSPIVEQDSAFLPSPEDTLLGQLQNAILALRDPAPGEFQLAPDDRSVEVHICHSLSRELEVLQDQLLARFAADEDFRPDQVLVVLPDMEKAAPLIEAIFGSAPPARRISYTITAQGQTQINPVARVLDSLLALCAGRCGASAVFDLLQQPPLAARFELSSADLDRIHAWIRDTGIHWGLDGGQRMRLDLPADLRHTFGDGLNRLFLAYALGDSPEAHATVLDGRIASGNPEGGAALVLGRFWRYVQKLGQLQRSCAQDHDADAWAQLLAQAVSDFTQPQGEWVDDQRRVLAAIRSLHEHMRHGGLNSPVPLQVIHHTLNAVLDDSSHGGVPSGGITFSALSSLRNLPYRMICLLGLDDGAFPSSYRPKEFDLMAHRPERGDRQRRVDERNLFLDLVLAAHERLYLSYSGRHIRDNSILPPSVLLAELLDYLLAACATNPDDMAAIRRQLIVEHPLQAFSPDYFLADSEPRRRSFNAEFCAALQQRATGLAPQPLPFFHQPLAPPPEEWRHVSLERLRRFFRNPCRVLLQDRLKIRLPVDSEELQDDEPFLPDYRGRNALAARLLPLLLQSDIDDDGILRLALAGHEFPPGAHGERLIAFETEQLKAFAARLKPELDPAPLPPLAATLEFQLDGEHWTLDGALGDIRANGLVRYRFDTLRPGDYLDGWLHHLFLCAADGAATLPHQTVWHARIDGYRLKPCHHDSARDYLRRLLELYRQGLRRPLHFFPKSAWFYMQEDQSLAAAAKTWENSQNPDWGESAHPAYQLALRGIADALNDEFMQAANIVYAPLIEHLE